MAAPWMLDESRLAGPEHLDPAFVAGYDRKQGYPDVDELLAVLFAHGLDEGGTLVDLGAGTGRLVLAAAPRVRRVVAVDVSPAMQHVLQERVAAAGLANVECVQAGLLTYEHRGRPADAVFTRNVLHHLPDFWKVLALSRIAGFLRPGGVLRLLDLVYDCQPGEVPALVERVLSAAPDDPAAGYTREDLTEHVRTEHSTFGWLLEAMLRATGFEIVTARYRQSVHGELTCVRA